jgi:hypothetical protein
VFKKGDPVDVAGYGPGFVVKDFGKKVRVKVKVGDTVVVPIVDKVDVTVPLFTVVGVLSFDPATDSLEVV